MARVVDQKKALYDLAEEFKHKLLNIKVVAFDIDGILTDGGITWDGDAIGFNRTTHAHDGYMMKFLQRNGIKVGIISGGDGPNLRKRFIDNLKLDFVFLGNEDKRSAFNEIKKMGFKNEEILYMGDEFIDIPLLKLAGFSATVPNASPEVQEISDYVTMRESGDACAREVMDILRIARNFKSDVLEF